MNRVAVLAAAFLVLVPVAGATVSFPNDLSVSYVVPGNWSATFTGIDAGNVTVGSSSVVVDGAGFRAVPEDDLQAVFRRFNTVAGATDVRFNATAEDDVAFLYTGLECELSVFVNGEGELVEYDDCDPLVFSLSDFSTKDVRIVSGESAAGPFPLRGNWLFFMDSAETILGAVYDYIGNALGMDADAVENWVAFLLVALVVLVAAIVWGVFPALIVGGVLIALFAAWGAFTGAALLVVAALLVFGVMALFRLVFMGR